MHTLTNFLAEVIYIYSALDLKYKFSKVSTKLQTHSLKISSRKNLFQCIDYKTILSNQSKEHYTNHIRIG